MSFLDVIRRRVAGRIQSGAPPAAAEFARGRPFLALSMLLRFGAAFATSALLGLLGMARAGLIHIGGGASGALATGLAAAAPYGVALAVGGWKIRAAGRRGRAAPDSNRAIARDRDDLILRVDHAGAVLSLSGDARRLFALEPEDLFGRGFLDRVHVGDRPSLLRAVDSALRSDGAIAISLKLRTGLRFKGGLDFDEPVFAAAALRIHRCLAPAGGAGEPAGTAVVCLVDNVGGDADAWSRAEGADGDGERSWTDRLLANVSHELRTPLNAIIGFSEILGSAELAPRDAAKQREYAGIIHDSAEHLLSVVNMILDMSKIEAGRFAITPEPFEVGPLIASCCDMLRLKADEGGVALIQAAVETPGQIVADKRSFRQIVINLLSNAVKFTKPGGRVTIGAWVEAECLVVCVEDTGIGIAPGHFAKLGKPFFQARSSYDRMFEGTGLGLSLVRGLVGLHGGSVRLESVVAQGTRIAFRLPLDCRDKAPSDPKPAPIEALSSLSRPVPVALTGGALFPVPRHANKEKRIA
ncbi:MAG: PAS domain-containing sensor histidine kinase [Roseiarcus sp.]